MSFNSPLFFAFLGSFLVLFSLAFPFPRSRLVFLLAANFTFLACGSAFAAALLAAYVAVSYPLAVVIARGGPARGAALAGAAVAQAASLVAFRAYQQFSPDGYFPLAFSFYAFVAIGYLTDLYFGRAELCGALEYATGLSFFPALVSGPIMRLAGTVDKLRRPVPLDWRRASYALVLVSNGLFKVGVAKFAEYVVSSHRNVSWQAPTRFAWIDAVSVTARIYADFSGYSDIAIGVGYLVGVEVPPNFRLPFLSGSMMEYWRRWHISLTHWIETYVFQPLVFGNSFSFLERVPRVGRALLAHRQYFAILFALMVCGLWHGFRMHFFLWGLYLGVLLCLNALFADTLERWPRALRVPLCFFLLVNAFALFDQENMSSYLSSLRVAYAFFPWRLTSFGVSYAVAAAVVLVVPHGVDSLLLRSDYLRGRFVAAFAVSLAFLSLHFVLVGFTGEPFVYFRF